MNPDRIQIRLAAVLGFLAVALGAFGAHGLKAVLEQRHAIENWHTAAHYHLIHAVALLALGCIGSREQGRGLARAAWNCMALGVIGFSGSLYAHCLTGFKPLVFVTPLGGVLLLAGWLLVAFRRW